VYPFVTSAFYVQTVEFAREREREREREERERERERGAHLHDS